MGEAFLCAGCLSHLDTYISFFYMAMFQLLFVILGSSGEGDAFMSSEFMQTLGHAMQDTYAGPYIVVQRVNVLIHRCPWFRNLNSTF